MSRGSVQRFLDSDMHKDKSESVPFSKIERVLISLVNCTYIVKC